MTDKPKKIGQVRFIYRKTRHHRTFHATGAWATVTLQLEVQIALYNDLRLMPDEVTNRLMPEGGIGELVSTEPPETDSSALVLREVDVTFVISKEVAKSLMDVLRQMVEKVDEHIVNTATAVESPIGESEVS